MALYKHTQNEEEGTLVKTYEDQEVQTFNFQELPENAQGFVAMYGLRQILSDAHSGVKDIVKVKEITARKWNDLMAGIFRRVAEGGAPKGFELLVQAVAKVKGLTEEDSRSLLEPYIVDEDDSDEVAKEKRAILRAARNDEDVKKAIIEITGKKPLTLDEVLAKKAA